MKKIVLTKGKFVLVDDSDYEWLSQWKWQYNVNGYATRGKYIKGSGRKNQRNSLIYMHRIIMNTSEKMEVDHINGKGLDNRKSNLRNCTFSQNRMNSRVRKDSKSGYKGIRFVENRKKWYVSIATNRKRIFLGYYVNKTEAIESYNQAARKYFNEYALLN